MQLVHVIHVLLVAVGLVVIFCRISYMSRATFTAVRVQHVLLFAGLLWSLIVPPDYAALSVIGGVVAFLLLSAPRWRHGAPEDTTRPGELGPPVLKHLQGGG